MANATVAPEALTFSLRDRNDKEFYRTLVVTDGQHPVSTISVGEFVQFTDDNGTWKGDVLRVEHYVTHGSGALSIQTAFFIRDA